MIKLGKEVYLTKKTIDILKEAKLQYNVDTYNAAIVSMWNHLEELDRKYNKPVEKNKTSEYKDFVTCCHVERCV